MTLELVSSRIAAPIVGSSVYTWTSVIGVAILGLAVGSLLGGYFADKFPKEKTLSIALASSSLLVFVVPLLARHADLITSFFNSVFTITLFLSLFLFLLPSIAIGSLSPIILKLFAKNFSSIGKEYAFVSATWSFGSILGVFLTGYLFVAKIGSAGTLNIVAGVLLLLAFIFAVIGKDFWNVAGFSILIFGIAGLSLFTPEQKSPNLVYEKETSYYLARVVEMNTLGKLKVFFLDYDSYSIDAQADPSGLYTDLYPVFSLFKPSIKKAHAIGGGAYVLPKKLKEYYGADVTVTEIDPEVRKISEDFFGLDSSSIKTIESDARVYLANTQEKYDLIIGDAYNSFISVPWHLLTKEFNLLVKERLNDGGVYALAFIGSFEGPGASIYESVRKTFSEVFPSHYVFALGKNPSSPQNIILIGVSGGEKIPQEVLKRKIASIKYGAVLRSYLIDEDKYPFENGIVLTDDYAPVEDLMRPLVKQYFKQFAEFLKLALGN